MFIVEYLGRLHKSRGEDKYNPSPRDPGGPLPVSVTVAGKKRRQDSEHRQKTEQQIRLRVNRSALSSGSFASWLCEPQFTYRQTGCDNLFGREGLQRYVCQAPHSAGHVGNHP